ncbi:TetR/AcrR family transcriptional regulator [Marinicella sp. W31]|uniref:TetR/AcrR family transcriptional regulator n=1 Tax=Marinicella sp. W31 TaxID=3023713 RepID=UPI0037579374
MGRARFNRHQVLEDATVLFWQHGYHGASMQSVFKATGLKPGSIYLAFGSKEGLFEATLEQYTEQLLDEFKQTLEQAESIGSGLCQLLYAIIDESQQCHYCSCFLIKSQLELAFHDNALAQSAQRQLQKIEALFEEYLIQAYGQTQGSIYHAHLMLQIFGLRVYGYTDRDQTTLTTMLQNSLPWLPWQAQAA